MKEDRTYEIMRRVMYENLTYLKREFPYMRGTGSSMSAGKNNAYLLAIKSEEVEK